MGDGGQMLNATALARLIELTARSAFLASRAPISNPLEWASLRYLGSEGRNARTAQKLANYLGVSETTAMIPLSSLMAQGLAAWSTPEEVDLELTSAGRALLPEDPIHILSAAIDHLSADQRTLFASLLETINANVAASHPPEAD